MTVKVLDMDLKEQVVKNLPTPVVIKISVKSVKIVGTPACASYTTGASKWENDV